VLELGVDRIPLAPVRLGKRALQSCQVDLTLFERASSVP
jgi:hypothetical protein